MTKERKDLYDRIASTIGNTPLYEIKNIEVPNGNKIFCKEEYLNPTGSHYDRFWIEYLRHKEDVGDISVDMEKTILESTTGNSGASFAWLCSALGYKKYKVVIPEDMPKARINQIKEAGAEVVYSPAGQYVRGLITKFRELLKEDIYVIPNHCVDTEISLSTMKILADEIERDLNGQTIDCFVSALGNGLNTRGIGEALKAKNKNMKIIGVEPAENPTLYVRKYDKTAPNERTHGLIGTAPGNRTRFTFNNIEQIKDKIDEIVLIEEKDWKEIDYQLRTKESKFVGHTSSACLKAALDYSQKVRNQIIVMLFYDPAWKYLDY